MKRIFTYLLFVVMAMGSMASPWDEDSVRSVLSDRVLDPIEGLWRFTHGGAEVLVHKVSKSEYAIRIIDSPQLNIVPGTLIGTCYATAKRNVYDGQLSSSTLGKKEKINSNNIVFEINAEGNLCLKPYRTGYSLSVKRLISRVLHITLVEHNERPNGLVGATRLYPYTPQYPVSL